MKNKIRFLLIILIMLGSFLVGKYDEIIADETKGLLLKTEGFVLDSELLKALSNPGTNNIGGGNVDKNGDGTLVLEEIDGIFALGLDCNECSITDWSDLKYFSDLQRLYIYNADGEKIAFNNIDGTNKINTLSFSNCINVDGFTGINNFSLLSTLSISTEETITCKAFEGYESIVSLYLIAPDITDIESLTNTNVCSLKLKSDTLKNIDELPNIKNLTYLDISGNNISDLSIIKNLPNLRTLLAYDNEIADASILSKYEHIQNIELERNKITDVYWINSIDAIDYLMLTGNPLTDMAKMQIINYGYSCENPIVGYVGAKLDISKQIYPTCDVVDYSKVVKEIVDTEIAEINGNVITFKKAGKTVLIMTYDDLEVLYDIVIEEKVITTSMPVSTATPEDDPKETNKSTTIPKFTEAPQFDTKKGDVNFDEKVNATDALAVLKHAAKIESLSQESEAVADVEADNSIDAKDALAILKIAAKVE